MSLFKLLFKFNPSKLKVIPAEQMSAKQQVEITNFLGDVVNRMLKGDFDTTPSQLKYLKDQGDEIARREKMIAERGSKGVGSLKPSAEVIDFPVTPKPPEGEPFKDGGKVKKKKPVIDPKDKGPFDDIFKKMFSEYEWEKKKKSYKDGFKDGGKIKKSKTDKIIDFLGGKDAVAAELGLLGIEQLYNLLGMPLGFAGGGAVGSPPIESNIPTTPLPSTQVPFYFNPQTQDELGFSTYTDFAQRGTRIEDMIRPSEVGLGIFGQYGNLSGGVRAPFTGPGSIGEPEFTLRYQKQFAKGGRIVGDKSGPPPEKGPDSQGLETLFQNR